jgi:DNA-binding transcriptional MocR family regulator
LPCANSFALDGTSGRPLYHQLVDWLRSDIAHRAVGDRIDSEPLLAERFGVSRFTVTRAIEILVDEGLVRPRQGLGLSSLLRLCGALRRTCRALPRQSKRKGGRRRIGS